MSDENFQDRLRRISAKSQIEQSVAEGRGITSRHGSQKPNYRQVGAGGAIIALGTQAMKFVTENYQSLKDSYGPFAGAAFGLAGAVVFLIGIVLIVRGSSKMLPKKIAPAGQYPANSVRAARKPSKIAQILFSLLGFVFGSVASFYMFMGAAARLIDTERAPAFANGCVIMAFALCLVSLLFGVVSLFLRGYALGRVPLYFLFGCVLTYVAVRLLEINMLEWQQLTDFLR